MTSEQTLELGQQRQVDAMHALQAQGIAMGGWKLGQTSGGSRDAFGKGYRAFGYVRLDRIVQSGASFEWQQMDSGGLETELCLVPQQDLIPTNGQAITSQQAREACWVAPGFELNQTRLGADAAHADRIADNLSNWGIVVGTPVSVPLDWQPDSLEVAMRHEGVEINRVAASGHIDDHFETIALLANRLASFGCGLKAGDRVITGAFGRVKDPQSGRWTGDFAELGSLSLDVVR